jgi:RES domain-containing protein
VDYPRALLEQLGELRSSPWSGRLFRWTFEGTPPDRPNTRGARWNPPDVAALYTCFSRRGVVAESDYLIAAQGIAPTRKRQVHTFELSLNSVLEITDRAVLARLGIDQVALTSDDQSKCQLVGGAVERLSHDGLIVPSARSSATNLVIFVNRRPLDASLELIETETIPAYKPPR